MDAELAGHAAVMGGGMPIERREPGGARSLAHSTYRIQFQMKSKASTPKIAMIAKKATVKIEAA